MGKQQKSKRQLLYVTVHEQIKDIIVKEGLKPGDRLPSENELINQLGVSRGTLRQALMLLRESGVIYNHQGKGTFLSPANKNTAGLEKTSYDMMQFAIVPIEKRELTVDYVPSSATVQEYMEHSTSTLMARFQILYYYNDEAIAYRALFVPYKKLEEKKVAPDDTDGLMGFADDLLQNCFVTALMTIDHVEARESVAKVMRATDDTHLFCISEISRDKTHTVVAYSKFYCYPEYFKFVINRE